MSQSDDLRHLKGSFASRVKHILKGESSISEPTRTISTQPDQQDATDAQLTYVSNTQELTQTLQQSDNNTESAMSKMPDAAGTQPSAATLQAIQPVRTIAGPALAAAEPMSPQSLWYSNRTPKWNDAVNKWMAENPEGYLELEKMTEATTKSPIERLDALSLFQPASKSSRQIPARFKRWQSTFAAIRGIGMSIAALDPHKIAPIICASVFFSIDILFENMKPEERDKILDILFDCGNTIRECISFEMNFSPKCHPAIGSDISVVEDLLPDQYIRSLQLMYDIQRSFKKVEREDDSKQEKWKDWVQIRGRNLSRVFTGKYAIWESDAREIKRQKDSWTAKKKILEDSLSTDKSTVEVQRWIKKDSDPEPRIDTIKRRVMPDGNYKGAAEWFLDSPEFDAWCATFLSPECPPAAKRVLWLQGTYGTGKTTLLYHTYNALKENPKFHTGSRVLRVVPYFCDAKGTTTRPDYETIIRALIRHLSLLPDFTLAKSALNRYHKATSTRGDDPDISEWEDLFKELVAEGAHEHQFVFVVDALDECLDLREAELFLNFMSNRIMRLYPNVYLLCSSHQQVRVNDYFCGERRHDVEVTPAATAHEMETFITGERARRKGTSGDSVFYQPEHIDLLDNLQKLLLEHAHGMFRWVQIWLDICLPAFDDLKTIRKRDTATELLKQLRQDVTHTHDAYQLLDSGYQRLWDFNDLLGYQKERVRLFHIVLGAFEPLGPESLLEALRIQGKTYNQDLTSKMVKRLYSNFLYEDSPKIWKTQRELRFVHESARKFIINLGMRPVSRFEEGDEAHFCERNNHLAIAELYIDVVGLATHPYWKANGLEPSNWTQVAISRLKVVRLWQERDKLRHQPESFCSYLMKNGLRHCAVAAKKRSMFDAVWSKVLDCVVLNSDSALGYTIQVANTIYIDNAGSTFEGTNRTGSCFLGALEGQITLLPSHVLAVLNIIHEDDVSRLRLEEDRQQRLFKHVACVGGNIDLPLTTSRRRATATALHLACDSQNRAAVDMILQASKCLSNDSARLMLFTKCYSHGYPIAIATLSVLFRLKLRSEHRLIQFRIVETLLKFDSWGSRDRLSKFRIFETLLKFERWDSSMRDIGSHPKSATEPYISKQWSLIDLGKPVLFRAARYFEENQMCHLLSVAQPEDINIRDFLGYTVLHRSAQRGFLTLVRELVEKYDADIEAEGKDGKTPSAIASENGKDGVVAYFKSRGANVDFSHA